MLLAGVLLAPVVSATNLTATSELFMGGRTFEAHHPPGYRVEFLNLELILPRILFFHGERLFIGSRSGNIYRLDPPYTETHSIAKLPDYPHSVVVRDDYLYVARINGVFRARYDDTMDWIPEEDFSLYVRLPGGKGHKTRTLKLSPDNELFVSLGIRGNCSDEYLDDSYPFKKRRGGLYRINESAEPVTLEPFASGLRNPVGFDWHPESGEIYANNNGPDHLGFESPPEYFSRIMPGSFHGMPWYQYDGSTMVRDECIESEPPLPADALTLPLALFPARNAPMDMVFLPNSAKASEFAGDAIVALRGSWAVLEDDDGNPIPTSKREPKLAVVRFRDGKPHAVEDLVTGFQSPRSGNRWARPVGVAVGPDGDIYFSSDEAAQGIYRLRKIP